MARLALASPVQPPAIDLRACVENLRRQTARRQTRLDQRFALATQEAAAIIELIAQRYRPRRIYQWGSLLDRRRFWEHSDIDIAVEGIADVPTFFALYGDADALATFPLDLIEIERIEPEFADLIRQNGRIVWERADTAEVNHS